MEDKISGIAAFMNGLLQDYEKLRGKSKNSVKDPFWDVVVITTADESQKTAYEIQLENKLSRNELPLDLSWFIIADPPGAKIGNGGSTLIVLESLYEKYGDKMFKLKILLLHAGGWSQRMPSASILGKIFTAVPHGDPIYQMLDISLALYWPFVKKMTAGVMVVCPDVFLTYNLGNHTDWKVRDSGFTALAHPSPMKLGNGHGVFVVKDPQQIDNSKHIVEAECLEVLQKPSDELMQERGAVFAESSCHTFADGCSVEGKVVYTDSNFLFGIDVMKKLIELKQELGVLTCEIDAYGDFLQALGPQATDKYIKNTSNISEMTQTLTECRLKVFEKLKGTDIHILIMNASKFKHIGTTKEYLQHFCEDFEFRKEMGIESDVFNNIVENPNNLITKKQKLLSPISDSSIVMHSSLLNSSVIKSKSVLEYCHFDTPIEVGSNTIVSNCQCLSSSASQLKIPANVFIHSVPICTETMTKFVTVFFHIDDNLKKSMRAVDILKLNFMKSDLGNLAEMWGLKSFYSSVNNGVCSLWTVNIFPSGDSMTQSFELSLKMLLSITEKSKFSLPEGAQLFSFADLLKYKDIRAMISYRESVRQLIKPLIKQS